MADKKISALTAATTPLAGTEVLPIVQSSATVKVAVSDLTAGRAISATQLTLTTGNLIVASGQGVDFSATPGTGSSELFNDYEIGTWTPNQGSGLVVVGTFSSSGTYTKIGRTVFVTGTLTGSTSVSTGTGDVMTSNLPFTSLNAGSYGLGNMTNNSLNVTSSTWVNANSTTLYGTVSVAATTNVFFTAVYQTA